MVSGQPSPWLCEGTVTPCSAFITNRRNGDEGNETAVCSDQPGCVWIRADGTVDVSSQETSESYSVLAIFIFLLILMLLTLFGVCACVVCSNRQRRKQAQTVEIIPAAPSRTIANGNANSTEPTTLY